MVFYYFYYIIVLYFQENICNGFLKAVFMHVLAWVFVAFNHFWPGGDTSVWCFERFEGSFLPSYVMKTNDVSLVEHELVGGPAAYVH